jgi:pimeloyl-ACP methyl ester carboxylesterase
MTPADRGGRERLHLTTTGHGPDVVLLHGIPGSADTWRAVAPALAAAGHRVTVAELLGFGASPRPDGISALWATAQATALAAALDAAGIARATVVGHDFGGAVALALLGARPRLVGALGLVATNAFADALVPLPIAAVRWPVIGPLAAAALFSRPSLALMLRQGRGASPDGPRAEHALGDAAQRRAIATVFAHALRELSERYAPLEEALRGYAGPALVAWGDRDPFFPVAQGERTAGALADGDLRVYASCGHYVPEERPRELAADVAALARRMT